MKRRTFEEILHVIFVFPTILSSIKQLLCQFIFKNGRTLKNSLDSLPQRTRKGYGMDTQGRIRPTPFLRRLKRVMEGIPREEFARLPSLDDSKGLWKGYPEKNPFDSLPRMTRKVMEGIPNEESAQLPSSDNSKGL
jgi:hypothetical protein